MVVTPTPNDSSSACCTLTYFLLPINNPLTLNILKLFELEQTLTNNTIY